MAEPSPEHAAVSTPDTPRGPSYLRIKPTPPLEGESVRAIRVSDTVLVDVDAQGRVIGVECLNDLVGPALLLAALGALRVALAQPITGGARVWAPPGEPGPEVKAVRDCQGRLWHRHDRDSLGQHGWRLYALSPWTEVIESWSRLIEAHNPLTDATQELPEADRA